MQRIYPCELTPEQYIATEAHLQVRAEGVCPRCGTVGSLRRHGVYRRGITGALGQILSVLVARFLCLGCRRTVSYLPAFALSYRLVQTSTVEAFLDGELDRRDVQTWQTLLPCYGRAMARYAAELFRLVGCGLGRKRPLAQNLWPWLKAACGSLAAATRQLVTVFQITLFKRYQCHQPARG